MELKKSILASWAKYRQPIVVCGLVVAIGILLVALGIQAYRFWQEIYFPPPPLIRSLHDRIDHADTTPNPIATKYAVLINGNNEERFMADMAIAYQVLLEQGFRPQNIYVLDYTPIESYWYRVDGAATTHNLRLLFDYLGWKISSRDLLFVYVTDHGGQLVIPGKAVNTMEFHSTLVLVDTAVTQQEFAKLIYQTNPHVGVLIFNQCYSGGFAQEVGKNNFIGIASTKSTELGKNLTGDSFNGFFMQAFRNLHESDRNGDGRISIQEAFDYAIEKNTFSKNHEQTPFIQTELDPSHIYLDFP